MTHSQAISETLLVASKFEILDPMENRYSPEEVLALVFKELPQADLDLELFANYKMTPEEYANAMNGHIHALYDRYLFIATERRFLKLTKTTSTGIKNHE